MLDLEPYSKYHKCRAPLNQLLFINLLLHQLFTSYSKKTPGEIFEKEKNKLEMGLKCQI